MHSKLLGGLLAAGVLVLVGCGDDASTGGSAGTGGEAQGGEAQGGSQAQGGQAQGGSGGAAPACGDGALDAGEDCDGDNLDGASCTSLGFGSGSLACGADCTFDTAGCDPCGNDTVDAGEACDGADLGGENCVSQGFGSGTLGCAADCSAFDTSACDPCGNNVLDAGEDCDGADLGGATCNSLGFDSGALACAADCTLDTTVCNNENCTNAVDDTMDGLVDCLDTAACANECADACLVVPQLFDPSVNIAGDTTGHPNLLSDACYPGNGTNTGTEVVYTFTPMQTGMLDVTLVSPGVDLGLSVRTVCGDNASELACYDEAFPGSPFNDTETVSVPVTAGQPVLIMVEGYGPLDAGAFTISAATRPIVCGDDAAEGGELCDGIDLNGGSCVGLGFTGGAVTCNAMCNGFVTTACTTCGNGVIEAGEVCDDSNANTGDGCAACACESTRAITADPNPDAAIVDNAYTGTLASMTCVPVVVPAVAGCNTLTSVSVTAAIAHTWVGDMTVKLVHPDSTVITLMSRPGVVEAADNGVDSPFGDSSNLVIAAPITFQQGATTSAEAMGTGLADTQNVCVADAICTFAPANGAAASGDLATLVGKAASGTWQFCVGDSAAPDPGTIGSVTLTLGQ